MMCLRCFFPGCDASIETGASLFRINATGQPGIWACRAHRANTDAPRDEGLDELIDLMEGRRAAVPEIPKRKRGRQSLTAYRRALT